MAQLIPTTEQILDESSFYPLFLKDLQAARGLVLIQSAFLSIRRIDRLAETLSACAGRGVRICAFVQQPEGWLSSEPPPRLRPFQGAVELLESLGVHVNLRPRVHQKVVVIDEVILYTGSLNVVSQYDSEEEMRRYECRLRTREAIARCRLDCCNACAKAGIAPSLGQTTVDGVLADLGKRLAERRQALGLSQKQIAARSGVPQNIVSEIECGKRKVRIDTLVRLCTALETELLVAPRHLLPAVRGVLNRRV